MYITFYALSSDNWRPPDSRAFSRSSGRIEVTFPAQWVTDLTTPSSHHCRRRRLHQSRRTFAFSAPEPPQMFSNIIRVDVRMNSHINSWKSLTLPCSDVAFCPRWRSYFCLFSLVLVIFSSSRGNKNLKFAFTHKNLQHYSFLNKTITVDYHIFHFFIRSWFSVILLLNLNIFD